MKIGEFVYDKSSRLYGIYIKDVINNTYKFFVRYKDKNTGLYKYDYMPYKKLTTVEMTRKLFPNYEAVYKNCIQQLVKRKYMFPNKVTQLDYAIEKIKEFYKEYANDVLIKFKEELSKDYNEVTDFEVNKSYFCIFSFKRKTADSSVEKVYDLFLVINNLGYKDVVITENQYKYSDSSILQLQNNVDYINGLENVEASTKNLNVFTLSNLQERVANYLYKGGPLNLKMAFKLNGLSIYNNSSPCALLSHFYGVKEEDFISLNIYMIGDVQQECNYSGKVKLNEFYDGQRWNIQCLNKKVKSYVEIK